MRKIAETLEVARSNLTEQLKEEIAPPWIPKSDSVALLRTSFHWKKQGESQTSLSYYELT